MSVSEVSKNYMISNTSNTSNISNVSVYYVANAGIYLTDGTSGILVDGLFDIHEGFDSLPAAIETAILEKQAPFTNISDLIFTHTHEDHYSPVKVSMFQSRYPQTKISLPENPIAHFSAYTLDTIPARHLLDKGKQVPHRALFLQYGGKNFFFSGDADPVFLNKTLSPQLRTYFQGNIDIAFINPFFLSLTPGRKFLDTLAPHQTFVYHMPLQAEDTLRYHEILERGMKKYHGTLSICLPKYFMEQIL